MADSKFHIFNDLQNPNPSGALIAGSIVIGGSGAVSSTRGKGFTVTKESADGQYTVQLLRPVTSILSVVATLLAASASALRVQVLSIDAANKRFVLQVVNASPAAANPASGNEVHFSAIVTQKQAL